MIELAISVCRPYVKQILGASRKQMYRPPKGAGCRSVCPHCSAETTGVNAGRFWVAGYFGGMPKSVRLHLTVAVDEGKPQQ
jgi:hypothetical protein